MQQGTMRKAIYGGAQLNGVHCSSTDIMFYEMCGIIGYDYVWIDMEHAPVTLPVVLSGIIAAHSGGCPALVRVRANTPESIKPVLEMGPEGIVFPMIENPEDAEKVIGCCLYPPSGTRGFGPLRANRYGSMGLAEYTYKSEKNPLKIIQCESKRGVKNLPDILKVPGIDCVICGPMDLSASVGKLGDWKEKEVLSLMNSMIDTCKNESVPFGISLGIDLTLRDFWLQKGASLVSMGNPYSMFSYAGKQLLGNANLQQSAGATENN